MMKGLLPILLAVCLLLFSACRKKEADRESLVGQVALEYYGYLLRGDCASYVDAVWREKPLRPSERAELIDNVKMFAAGQEKERCGIKSADVDRVEISADGLSADVFLLLLYGDSTREQVLLPMTSHGGIWYLR